MNRQLGYRILLFASLLVLTSCGDSPTGGRVDRDSLSPMMRDGTVDRSYKGVGQIPPTSSSARYSAVLIGRRMILTSAQALDGVPAGEVRQFSLDKSHTARITAITIHPNYHSSSGVNPAFDVAVGLLDETQVRKWSSIPRYPLRGTSVWANSSATGVGFGETSNGAGAGTRRSAVLRVAGIATGSDNLGNVITEGFLYVVPTNNLNQLFCPGDFGGPLFTSGTVGGVASYANGDCNTATGAYCVPVSRLSSWIVAAANALDPNSSVVVN